TSWPRDWSSDVCSSDLHPGTATRSVVPTSTGGCSFSTRLMLPSLRCSTSRQPQTETTRRGAQICLIGLDLGRAVGHCACVRRLRSEERRVGKECSVGWV